MSAEFAMFGTEQHTIIQGDAIEVLQNRIPDRSIDLIFADPPYNIGKQFGDFKDRWDTIDDYVAWCRQWLLLCIEKLKLDGSMYVMTSTQAMPHLDLFLRDRITILGRLVWNYDSSGVQAKNHFGSMYEPILHCVRNPRVYTFNGTDILVEAKTGARRKLIDYRKNPPVPYSSNKVPGNVWHFPRVRYRMRENESHPAQKPESLLERIILTSSNAGDMVLDPFAGTFTTNAVAKKLHRQSIGVELVSQFVEIGLRRVLGFSAHNGKELVRPLKNTKRRNSRENLFNAC